MADGNVLVSVIVTVYNGEDYLDKCIESILSQTYTDLEILFVDDGSIDSSPQILDDYSIRDKRIRVVHQSNGGRARARNTGIKASTGRYVIFIDMDDWIEPDMISIMLDDLLKYEAQMVICGYSRDYKKNVARHIVDDKEICTGKEALARVLEGTIDSFTWNKLCDRSLFEKFPFPEGRNYEDIAVMYRVVESASKVVLLPDILYHYVYRKNSIVAARKLKDLFMRVEIEIERYQYVMKCGYPEYGEAALLLLLNSYRPLMVASVFSSFKERKSHRMQRKEYDNFLKRHFKKYVGKQERHIRIQYYLAVRGMFMTDVLALACEWMDRIKRKRQFKMW